MICEQAHPCLRTIVAGPARSTDMRSTAPFVGSGSATGHGGKPSAYRLILMKIPEAEPQENRGRTESQRLSAMCCAKGALTSSPRPTFPAPSLFSLAPGLPRASRKMPKTTRNLNGQTIAQLAGEHDNLPAMMTFMRDEIG